MNTFDFFDDSNIPDASYGYSESQPPPLSQPNVASMMPLISLDLNSASQMECDLPVAEVDDNVLPVTVIRSSPPTQPPPLSPMTPSQTSSARRNNSPPASQLNLQSSAESTERSATGNDLCSQSQSSQPIIRNAPSISLAALLNPVFPMPEAIRPVEKPAQSERVYALPTQLAIESQVFDDIPPPFPHHHTIPLVPPSSQAAPTLSPAPQSLPARAVQQPVCDLPISPPVHLIRSILAAEHSPLAIAELVQLIRTNSAFEQLSQCPEWSMLIAAQASHVVPSNALVEADTEEEDQPASQSRLGVLQHDFSPSPPSSPEFTAVKSPLVSVLQPRSMSVSQPFVSNPAAVSAAVAAPNVASSDVVGTASTVFVPESQASSNLSRHSSASRDSVPFVSASESIADDASSEARPSTTKKKRKRSDRTKQVTLDAFMTSRSSAVIDMANSADDDEAADLSAALLISARTAAATSSSTLFPEHAGIAHATMIAPSNLYSQAQSQYEYEDPFRLSLPKKSPAASTPLSVTPSTMPLSTRLMRTSTAARFRSALAEAPKSPPPSARTAPRPRTPTTPLLPDSQPADDVLDVISTKVPALRTLPSFARPSARLNPPPASVPAIVPEPESQVF